MWRERALLTQEQLAERAGVSVGTVRGMESGRIRRPHSESLRLLADGLRLSADDRAALVATARGGPGPEDTPLSAAPATWQAPRQLPAPPQMFTGRVTELAELEKVHDASTVVITAIDGMAGVGKTALAVLAAHQMVERYPDGQLFIDLHGYTHGVAPVDPGVALDRLLRSLGFPGDGIPADLDERAGLYRSRLADLRMVIVLDNAATEAQVMPLLPGASGCLALITSRRRLSGLDHTHTVSLDTLPLADAITLLRQTADESRLAGEPPALVAELVELCGRLPLAIRIAAARLRSHPAWGLAHLVQRLRDQQHRLIELAAGQRSVTAALDLSYQQLTPDQQRAYRMLGLHPGADVDTYATAALLDATLPAAGQLLDQLLEFHLLGEPVPGRYRFHDLTRAHAAHAAAYEEAGEGRQAALDRLLDYYRYAATLAMDAAYPYERAGRPQVPPAHTPVPALSEPAPALVWLDNELPNLLVIARFAAEHDRLAHLLHLSTIMHRHLRSHGRLHDAAILHEQALTVARAAGNEGAELEALIGLGHIHRLRGRHEQAIDHYRHALQFGRTIGHRVGQLEALVGLGHLHRQQSQYEQALDDYQQALQIAGATGRHAAAPEALGGLGWIHLSQRRYEQANELFGRALRLARATGHRPGELNALTGLAHVDRLQGSYEQAIAHYRQALQLAHSTGNRIGELNALSGLAHVRRIQGRYGQANDHYQRLLDLAIQCSSNNYQFEGWQGLGRVLHATAGPEAAITHHHRALALANELGQPEDQARAHDGLALAHQSLHQYEDARRHWQRALDILAHFGVDHTHDEETTVEAIRTHLVDIGHDERAAPTG